MPRHPLIETYDHHRARGNDPDQAARAAIQEFGTAEQIIAAFDRIEPGRSASRRLLASGPLVGLGWGAALVSSRVWTWSIPTWTSPVLAGSLMTVIALLLVAAKSRRFRHAAPLGAGGLILLDILAISGVLTTAPAMSWPLRLAILASLARAYLSARTLPALRPH